MKTAKELTEPKGPDLVSEYLGGAYAYGLQMAKSYGVSVESAEREARHVREIRLEALNAPGGALGLVTELANMRGQLSQTQSQYDEAAGSGHKESRGVRELASLINSFKQSIKDKEAFLDTLPS